MAKVQETGRVTYESSAEDAFQMEKNRQSMNFGNSKKGLYYSDSSLSNTYFVDTVKKNELPHTNRKLEKTKTLRRLLAMVGQPSSRDMINLIKLSLIPNFPVTIED
eukprot:8232926-Ditylum_brightwellii.AAC.1